MTTALISMAVGASVVSLMGIAASLIRIADELRRVANHLSAPKEENRK